MTTRSTVESGTVLDPRTRMGTVRLTVKDLDRSRAFYERVLGLRAHELSERSLGLHAGGGSVDAGEPLVELHGDPAALPFDPTATGLFHFALLFPNRQDLAVALARVAAAGWSLTGASDHLVSEALYLRDPDGHGIELYCDRPRSEWEYEDGAVQMDTLRLDLDDLACERPGGSPIDPTAPAGTTMGHVHLQVSELTDVEAFYHGVIGFDVMVRSYPGALFLSAGGYHHHLGLNIWNSRGSHPPAPGSVALRSFDIMLPDRAALDAVVERATAAGVRLDEEPEGMLARDPSGNGVLLRTA